MIDWPPLSNVRGSVSASKPEAAFLSRACQQAVAGREVSLIVEQKKPAESRLQDDILPHNGVTR
jgi:hypothetical protein